MILIDLIDNTFPAITIDMSTLFMKWRYQVDDGQGGVGKHARCLYEAIHPASSLGSMSQYVHHELPHKPKSELH